MLIHAHPEGIILLLMKLALAQINPTVGDIAGNARLIRRWVARAKTKGAGMVIFPELCITCYPPRDLVGLSRFVERNKQAVQDLARQIQHISVIVGFVDYNPLPYGNKLCNAAAVLQGGKIKHLRFKSLLPTYDVFDESRNF